MNSRERLFDRHPTAVRATRDFVAGTLARCKVVDRLDDVQLCVSELATNAVEHCAPTSREFLVRLASRNELLRIEVHDSGDGQPEIQGPKETDDDGRGFLLVASIADDWGVERRNGPGKVVWCEFKVSVSGGERGMALSAQPASAVPTAGLLASLGAWTWISADQHGDPLGIVLLAHPPARRRTDTPEVIERSMRGLADALGLVPADDPLADIGPRATIHPSSRVLLHPDGVRFAVQLPAYPQFVRLLLTRHELAVAVGLDSLARGLAPPRRRPISMSSRDSPPAACSSARPGSGCPDAP